MRKIQVALELVFLPKKWSMIKRHTYSHVAYLSHGSGLISKLYSVWKTKLGLISYIMCCFMESPAALQKCVCCREECLEHVNTGTVLSSGGGLRATHSGVNTHTHTQWSKVIAQSNAMGYCVMSVNRF